MEEPELSGEDEVLRQLKAEHPVRAGLIGDSPALRTLFDRILRLAEADVPILVRGEVGVGKDNVARAVHLNSGRSAGPFVAEGAATLREEFAISQLFGHVRGAFTGATAAAPGLLDLADGGTLYLDEVAELSAGAQACLLRVLESGEYRALGSPLPRRSDFRLVCSTGCDLEALVTEGLFRRDLYFRLRGAIIDVPPLRHRRADIPDICASILREEARRVRRAQPSLSSEAQGALLEHSWPGNVRELRQELRQALALCPEDEITPAYFQFVREPVLGTAVRPQRQRRTLKDRLGTAETEVIRDALKLSGGNKAEAARRLGMTRRTLYRRLEAFKLQEQPHTAHAAGDRECGETRAIGEPDHIASGD
jgi:DNA-binding NtrC family response regulator